jgi:hypothetical protein
MLLRPAETPLSVQPQNDGVDVNKVRRIRADLPRLPKKYASVQICLNTFFDSPPFGKKHFADILDQGSNGIPRSSKSSQAYRHTNVPYSSSSLPSPFPPIPPKSPSYPQKDARVPHSGLSREAFLVSRQGFKISMV